MATWEVARARREVAGIERTYRQAIGAFQTRRQHAQARLDRAMEAQDRMQAEHDRLVYTLSAGFGVTLGQQSLFQTVSAEPKLTFIQKTSQAELRARIRELRKKLNEAPG